MLSDGATLTDELIQALFRDDTLAIGIDVHAYLSPIGRERARSTRAGHIRDRSGLDQVDRDIDVATYGRVCTQILSGAEHFDLRLFKIQTREQLLRLVDA